MRQTPKSLLDSESRACRLNTFTTGNIATRAWKMRLHKQSATRRGQGANPDAEWPSLFRHRGSSRKRHNSRSSRFHRHCGRDRLVVIFEQAMHTSDIAEPDVSLPVRRIRFIEAHLSVHAVTPDRAIELLHNRPFGNRTGDDLAVYRSDSHARLARQFDNEPL